MTSWRNFAAPFWNGYDEKKDEKDLAMKKLMLYLLCVFFGMTIAHAEVAEFKILYLIPFETGSYSAPFVKESEDMDRVKSYQLMGFWNGAQMAIEESGKAGSTRYNIVVRDVSNNEAKLRNIMEDSALMQDVDLIIGPFFGKMFEIATEYAKRYQIPIVNPFTSRQDFVENNEYVYKLIPSLGSRPALIAFLSQQSDASIIILGDSVSNNREMNVYLDYFKKNNVDFELLSNVSSVVNRLSENKPVFVITFYDNPAKNLVVSRSLVNSKRIDKLTFVVPESWLESKTYDIEYYSRLNLHFFSDYYVDYDAEDTKTFIYDYTQRFGVPPTLESFAFQGYDITRYFIDFLNSDKDVDRVKVTPLAFPLSFDKLPDGGFENVNVQFLEVKDNEIVPSIY